MSIMTLYNIIAWRSINLKKHQHQLSFNKSCLFTYPMLGKGVEKERKSFKKAQSKKERKICQMSTTELLILVVVRLVQPFIDRCWVVALPSSSSLSALLNLSATIFTRCNLSNGAKNQIVSRVHKLHCLAIGDVALLSQSKFNFQFNRVRRVNLDLGQRFQYISRSD